MRTQGLVSVLLLFVVPVFGFGQSVGDYQTFQSGNWNDVNTWSSWNGSSWVNPVVITPDSSVGKVSILNGHTITITADVVVDSVFVNTGGTLMVNSGDTVTVGPPYLAGQAGISVSGTMIVNGIYKHARNGGSIPIATWNTGSTCLITGATANAPSNTTQNFYNFTWNCPAQSANLSVGWQNGTVIAGTLTVTNSNWNHASTSSPANQFRLFGASGSCTLNNVVVNGYNAVLTAQGSSYTDTVTVNGDITLSKGGMLSLANNSTAITTYFVKGDFTVIDSVYLGKSNAANTSKFVFCKSGVQSFSLPASGVTFVSAPNIVDSTGSTLNMGTSVFSGAGSFQVQAGATLGSGHANGINGNVTCTGANGGGNIFNTGANYTFNGSGAQVTGTLLPATVNNLTINNSAGVTLSSAVTVNGTLYLTAGVFNNSSATLTAPTIVYGTGSLSTPLPVELTSFTGSANGRNVDLAWTTSTEINNNGFEVQKNIAGSWVKIGFVDGAGTSNVAHSYSFADMNSVAATYSYRLKQIDHDGKFAYSTAIEVTTTLSAKDFALSQNYPNPFNPSTKFSFAAKNAERTTVKIYNVVGQEVATLFNDVAQPNQMYTVTFDARNLPSGTYFYVLHSASRNEVKKMMLMK